MWANTFFWRSFLHWWVRSGRCDEHLHAVNPEGGVTSSPPHAPPRLQKLHTLERSAQALEIYLVDDHFLSGPGRNPLAATILEAQATPIGLKIP